MTAGHPAATASDGDAENGRPEARAHLTPVHVERLTLTDFRNYAALRLDLEPRHVVLTGENGAGKTNLLEAVSYLVPGRGLRRVDYRTVSRAASAATSRATGDDEPPWAVNARMEGMEGPVSLGTGIARGANGEVGRRVQINGARASGADALLEHCRVLWLTPSQDGLFTGPASDRRRFLDRMVLATDPGHGRRVAEYERVMRGRNRLLEEGARDERWMNAQERQLAELGVAVALARQELVDVLTHLIERERDPSSPFPDARLELDGALERQAGRAGGFGAAADLEDEFRALLARNRSRDRAAGRTTDGPHRTDLLVRHGPKSIAAALCSTGEQKALLIGLVLAHARLVGELTTATPILLLDEIAAHLDAGRRAALFDRVDAVSAQSWMTGTDAALFEALGARAQHLTVHDGTVS